MDNNNDQINTTDPIISIGTVADKIGVSVSNIRKYEAEGLIIPYRSESGHRLFSVEDIDRIRTIQRLIQVGGLNIEGIRRLQALLPCWEILPCTLKKWKQCPAFKNSTRPCWMMKGVVCAKQGNECRICHVYRFGSIHIEDIKEVVYRKNQSTDSSKLVKQFLNNRKT